MCVCVCVCVLSFPGTRISCIHITKVIAGYNEAFDYEHYSHYYYPFNYWSLHVDTLISVDIAIAKS